MTDKPDLDELARLLEKATPGPWYDIFFGPEVGGPQVCISCTWPDFIGVATMDLALTSEVAEQQANAAVIVALRNAAPPLIAEVEALRGEVDRLREALGTVMAGGNHLALLIGADHLPFTDDPSDALEHYGAGDAYEVWCCWRSIMQARAALGEDGK